MNDPAFPAPRPGSGNPVSGPAVDTRLVSGPLSPDLPAALVQGQDAGAEVVFHGRVRGEERGQRISALDYEDYPGLTEKELDRLAREAVRRFAVHELVCHHRTGRVPVGDIALRIVIRSRHRTEAFEALAWFVLELKNQLPLWKWIETPDGSVRPASERSRGATCSEERAEPGSDSGRRSGTP